MTESQLEEETLAWLRDVGYTTCTGAELERQTRQVLLLERLQAAIHKLNPALPVSAQNDALALIQSSYSGSLLIANREFHRLLVNGVPVQYQKDGETRGDFVRLVDWDAPERNDWLAVNQLTVKGVNRSYRPDIVCYVNGLPLVVMELKNPTDKNADVWQAFHQLQTYKEAIADLFVTNELLVISDGSTALLGSLSADTERFMAWRTINGENIDPLGKFQGLQTLVRGILHPAYFLEYIRYFVLFEDDGILVKKIAGYHQFHAVRRVMERVINASRPEGSRKGGVVWHTQGSGKSITMTCFAARVMREPIMQNPTIVVITDRNDLDGQLFGVFSLAHDLLREKPVQATSRLDLREKLANRASGGIVFATIQKFMLDADENAFPMLSERSNIVVIADEAHRTQYGFEAKLRGKAGEESYQAGYAQHLRDALPNATFVAFTGTPVSGVDKNTRTVFGDYASVYDMQQAQEDGATVPIYYESRLAQLRLDLSALVGMDSEVDELAEDEEESIQAQLKTRWTALAQIVGAEPRITNIAADLIAHFEERNNTQAGKAMIVAMSREICVHLYNAIIKIRPEWHDFDPEKGIIKIVMTGSASDKKLLQPHIYSDKVKKRLEKRFKNPQDPLQLVIVRDMWLTGFDVPCVHTLYMDKPMQGHNLMQAIARVNRVFKDKQGGLVVDYLGIGHELETAMKEYIQSNGQGKPTVDIVAAYNILMDKLDILRSMLHGFDYSGFREGGLQTLGNAADYILGLGNYQDSKKQFSDTALALSHAFSLCCTLNEAKAVRDEVAFMQGIKSLLNKDDNNAQGKINEKRDFAIRQIINSAIVSERVVDIFDAVGLDKPHIGLCDKSFLAKVQQLHQKNLAVELLQRLLSDEIQSRFASNVVQNKRFSDLLNNVMVRYQNRSIETVQVMEELVDMAEQFREALNRGEKLGLSADEILFYDALANNPSAVRELRDETLKKIAHELTESLRKSISVDWFVKESVRAKLRIMVKRILKKYKYPPDSQENATDLVLEQAQALGETWEPSIHAA